MNILFLTLLDFSSINESGIYTDLMREFVKDNHKLYIISPVEKKKKITTKLIDNGTYKILKLKIGNIQKTNIIEKGLSTLSLESKFIKGIKKYFSEIKFDLVLYSTPPITFQKAVRFVKNRDNAKTYLLLKDIFPQNAIDIGILKDKGIFKYLYMYFRKKEKKLYHLSDFIGCMSEANVKFLLDHNPELNPKTVEVCPNSIEPLPIKKNNEEIQQVKETYGIPQDKIVFIYGGNLGKPQGIDFLIECLLSNKDNEQVFFIVAGSGTEFGKLNKFFIRENPANAKLFSQLPKEEYETLANCCDIGMIFLDKRFTIPNFPSRILSYMQASMPILAVTDKSTDIGEVINNGNFGLWCESGNIDMFNQNVSKLCDPNLRKIMGINSRKYLEEHYTAKHSYDIIMSHFK